ncbi:MAG: DNA alkylation repair protein [Candidatus Dadabacteria bacterium]|nr:DNA alkylation repair protein [Candidatus Dadabacteria bacterium]
MTLKSVMKELESYGNEHTKDIYIRHGAREPLYGVKIADLRKIVKKIKSDHKLALELYDTGNSDAMYLAGLIADPSIVTKNELRHWVKNAYCYMLSEYTVAGIAAESPYGWELSLEWINTGEEMVESAGWATLSYWVSLKPDVELHMDTLSEFMKLVSENIDSQEAKDVFKSLNSSLNIIDSVPYILLTLFLRLYLCNQVLFD